MDDVLVGETPSPHRWRRLNFPANVFEGNNIRHPK